MPELQSHFDDFRVELLRHLREVERERPEADSTAWFLLKYLRRIHRKAQESNTPQEIENTIRALIRYYVDQVDEGSELEFRCKDIIRRYRRSTRLQRNH